MLLNYIKNSHILCPCIETLFISLLLCPIIRKMVDLGVHRNKLTTDVVYAKYTMYICTTYCNIKMAAGLSAELKIKTKNIDKELSGLVDSSYFLYIN